MSATALHPPTNPLLPLAVLTGAIVAVAAGVVTQPGILANTSPSEPPGLYSRTALAPATGRLIAFHVPLAAFPYADRRLAYLHHTPILKAVAAAPGDRVCTRSGRLVINGADRAPIAIQDRSGHPLPRWIDCRTLRVGEFFVFSDRVPNSFDSRYYGPVDQVRILGVYAPLAWPWETR